MRTIGPLAQQQRNGSAALILTRFFNVCKA